MPSGATLVCSVAGGDSFADIRGIMAKLAWDQFRFTTPQVFNARSDPPVFTYLTAARRNDLAAVAIASLKTGAHRGEVLAVTGPEALTYAEMTAVIGSIIGRALTFVPLSDDEAA